MQMASAKEQSPVVPKRRDAKGIGTASAPGRDRWRRLPGRGECQGGAGADRATTAEVEVPGVCHHGAAGAYTSKFKQLDKELEEIREILRSASITVVRATWKASFAIVSFLEFGSQDTKCGLKSSTFLLFYWD